MIYLRHIITEDGKCEKEVRRRIEIARAAFEGLKEVLTTRNIKINTRRKLEQCYIWSTLLYAAETWTLNTNIIVDIKNSKKLFSFLQTNKRSRKKLKTILINLDYDFLTNQIRFNNIKIDNNNIGDELLRIVDGLNDNNLNNLNKTRRLLNKFFEAYEG